MLKNNLQERVASINGVSGRMFGRVASPDGKRYLNQRWVSESRPVKGYGTNGQLCVELRFDDECRNGHQTFAITASVYTAESRRQRDIAAGGCLHEEIARAFPELAPLIKWHLVSTDGPVHYVANTCYLASNRDHNGLLAGESRNFDAARSCAVWPEATDEQLSLPRAELATLLEARLPALLADFRADMLAAGFEWEHE